MDMPDTLQDWLTTRAWPLWLQHGVDWQGGAFNESLTLDTYCSTAQFRRLRVLARQIYVFSLAQLHGLAGADAAVELGLDFLLRRARQPDGGYAWRFDLAGRVIDDRRDLYDHAFVLLALAAAARVHPTETLRDLALELDMFITTRMHHSQQGYVESLPLKLPRRQNPHMHLLEAYLAAAETFGEERFFDRAREVVELCVTRFWDSTTSTLAELFDDRLVREEVAGRHLWEPGHHCEWIWLLDWYERLTRDAPLADVRYRLWQSVNGFGINNTCDGALLDEVWSDGIVKTASSRLWPQTERLKSALILRDVAPDERSRAELALRPFLRPDGTWYEHKTTDGTNTCDPAPASSLYHLTCGILFGS